ncbi:Cytochrome b-c1 complex subunit 8, mitochondrial [Rhizina undulata]
MGGGAEKVPGNYMGWWGNLGSLPQKGIATYALSANRQRPMAGVMHAAIFNSWRRFRSQVLYIAPPFVIAYFVIDWAERRNHFLNSKEGRALYAEEAE